MLLLMESILGICWNCLAFDRGRPLWLGWVGERWRSVELWLDGDGWMFCWMRDRFEKRSVVISGFPGVNGQSERCHDLDRPSTLFVKIINNEFVTTLADCDRKTSKEKLPMRPESSVDVFGLVRLIVNLCCQKCSVPTLISVMQSPGIITVLYRE